MHGQQNIKIFLNSPVPNLMKICAAALKLLRAYSWTDGAVLPALHRDDNAPKNKFSIHPGSSCQATCRKSTGKAVTNAICLSKWKVSSLKQCSAVPVAPT